MQSMKYKLWHEIDRERGHYVDLLRALVRAVPTGEEELQKRVARHFEELGCDAELLRHVPLALPAEYEITRGYSDENEERISVMGRRRGTGSGRSLLLYAHPDSEPVSGTESWQHDPFAAEVENGRLYGWGAADDLLGVAAMIGGLSAALRAGFRPTGDVILASTPSKRQAQGIVAVLDTGVVADGALYLHPAESGAGLGDIKAFTSGLLRFQITVPGAPPDTSEPTHTPLYHQAVNPIDKAWLVYQALQDLAEQRAQDVYHPLLEDSVGRSTNLHVSYINSGDPQKLSRVANEAVLGGSVTFPPGESLTAVQAQILEAVEAAAKADPWLAEDSPRVEWIMGAAGVEISEDSDLYQVVSQAIKSVTDIEPTVHSLHSASDIRVPVLYKGIPTIGFGSLAGNLVQAGGHDEWVDVDDYIAMLKVVATIICEWCGG